MKLEAVTVQRYRNFVDPQRIEIKPDVTCLVGKNESGKTTILKALHRLKPANGSDLKFDLTPEYPRWRLAADRRKDPDLAASIEPIQAEFSLSTEERDEFSKVFGLRLPAATRCHATRTYGNQHYIWLACTITQAAQVIAGEVGLDEDDLAALPQVGAVSDVVSAARKLAKDHRDSGEKARATSVTAFASTLEKYQVLTEGEVSDARHNYSLKEIILPISSERESSRCRGGVAGLETIVIWHVVLQPRMAWVL